MNNYTIIHLHTDLSNANFIDSATKYQAYIDKAAELGMKAIAFTEHGNVLSWVSKKRYCEEKGLKYIHGQEFYVTENLEKTVRDNYHICLYAKNYEGVKELNKLSTIASNRKDGHFYYDPRITYDELVNTSDNILITTACLGGIINKGNKMLVEKFINFLNNNSHRCFLEIQHHNVTDQIEYNKLLYKLNLKYNIPLIVGTDTHSLNGELADARMILQKSKNVYFENESEWDLEVKTYTELVELLKKQDIFAENAIYEALENTNRLADMVEDFELNYDKKYPKIFKDPEKQFNEKIKKGFYERKIDKLPQDKLKEYCDRITHELKTYKKNDAIEYMLLKEDIINYCHSKGIYPGYSRGSVSGSLIAYLLKITEVDSIKWGLNFERFMNTERVSLADIDIDYPPHQREMVKEYIFNKHNLFCCDIVTFNTIALKGAIRDVGRALKIDLNTIDNIAKNVESMEKTFREQYPELFKYVDLLQGVVVSIGSHPCGSVVWDNTLDDHIGLYSTSTSEYPISQLNMTELDSLNYVKLDILGLDNIQIINEACKLANIERLTPDNVDLNDEKVWQSITENNLGIFQWESLFAADIYKRLFDIRTLEKIKSQAENLAYIDLFSMGNGALRPAGESYRENMCKGIFNDNGHGILNEFLKPTMGYLVYQEQILEFLHIFCGFTLGEADIVRRGFAKKKGTDQYIPKIKQGFIDTMLKKYNVEKEQAGELIESFLKVIQDASDYLFSINHSLPYSIIGYVCAYLRYYYPLEFLTVLFNINEKDKDKTAKITEYAKSRGIKIENIKFRFSKGDYSFDNKTKTIYKGMSSVKYLNPQIAQELLNLKNNQYKTFTELLVDLTENTSCNTRQIKILITLNFFSEFGDNGKLLEVQEFFNSKYSKTHVEKTKEKRIAIVQEFEDSLVDYKLDISEQIIQEKEYLGYIQTTYDIDSSYNIVLEIDTKYTPRLTLYNFATGEEKVYKLDRFNYKPKPSHDIPKPKPFIDNFDIIQIEQVEERNKSKLVEGKWVKLDTTETFIKKYKVVKKSGGDSK